MRSSHTNWNFSIFLLGNGFSLHFDYILSGKWKIPDMKLSFANVDTNLSHEENHKFSNLKLQFIKAIIGMYGNRKEILHIKFQNKNLFL
jgi:hypothetical protein